MERQVDTAAVNGPALLDTKLLRLFDLYVWLAWRLHRLERSTRVSWPAIHAQFGNGFRAVR
jgi:hypothetical protein